MRKELFIKKVIKLFSLFLLLCLLGCGSVSGTAEKDKKKRGNDSWLEEFKYWAFPQDYYEKASLKDMYQVKDYRAIYEEPMARDVLYLTVGGDGSFGDSEHTWEEINEHNLSWYEERDEEAYTCDALVQFGNEDGPTSDAFGYGSMSANATVKLSGKKASTRQQKSYRIKINSGSGNVSGIKTLVLSKSFTDPFRFTNKLCCELMSKTDDMMSVRTEFVHLYVRDLNSEKTDLFVDYGLYTLVETVNKKYLSNRNLDSSGELYKINDFDFGRHSDVIMQPTEKNFDKNKFEELLEAKGSEDYSGLLEMLDALNGGDMSIEDVVKTYFDEDNLYTFMAFNILMDNKKTDTENFYLYSPMGVNKFYIIPWDNDGALRSDYERLRDPDYSEGYEKGIYLYTDSILFSRILKSRHCVDKLSEKIKELHESELSSENVSKRAKKLGDKVKKYLYRIPDASYARVTEENYDKLLEMIPEQIEKNYYAYYDSLETPWPFHIKDPELKDGHVIINWDESSMINGKISYDVEISDSWSFGSKLAQGTDLEDTKFDAGKLAPGQYFVRVYAKSDNGTGLKQEAFEYYNTEKKTTVHGVLCFYVKEDGTVVKSTFQEE